MAHILRVSILGAMPSGEEWSVNPIYSIGGDFGTPVSSSQANTIALAIAARTVPTGLTSIMNSTTTVTGVRVEARSLTGVLESQAEAMKAVATPGTGTQPLPFQSAAVISLRTALAGASGRGRMYWPATGMALVTTTLRPLNTLVTSVLSGAKTYLSGIQTDIDVTLDGVALGVWSRKLADINVVNQLQMGDIVDTQRRRRDQLIETYQSSTYP